MIWLSWAVLALGGVLLAAGFATGGRGWLVAAAVTAPLALVPLALAIRASVHDRAGEPADEPPPADGGGSDEVG